MAMGGKVVSIDIDTTKFAESLEIYIQRVERGTKKATMAACKEIIDISLGIVPKDTGTLANSAFWDVAGNYRIGFTGVVGYGGNGNPQNPKTGKRASTYMIDVHEDLSVPHKNGEAKFLEKAVFRYQKRFKPKITEIIRLETRR